MSGFGGFGTGAGGSGFGSNSNNTSTGFGGFGSNSAANTTGRLLPCYSFDPFYPFPNTQLTRRGFSRIWRKYYHQRLWCSRQYRRWLIQFWEHTVQLRYQHR